MSEILITKRDHGRTFEANQGTEITIRLEQPFTSGYCWEIGLVDSSVLEHLSTEHVESETDAVQSTPPETGMEEKPALGRPLLCNMRFRAKAPGSGSIQLNLRRPWEPADAAEECFEVYISVR